VAQSATARALGGPEVREQFATRILARYSVNAWCRRTDFSGSGKIFVAGDHLGDTVGRSA
ncbi:hypothetical protein, partial [Streptomyces jumonjinensis]